MIFQVIEMLIESVKECQLEENEEKFYFNNIAKLRNSVNCRYMNLAKKIGDKEEINQFSGNLAHNLKNNFELSNIFDEKYLESHNKYIFELVFGNKSYFSDAELSLAHKNLKIKHQHYNEFLKEFYESLKEHSKNENLIKDIIVSLEKKRKFIVFENNEK